MLGKGCITEPYRLLLCPDRSCSRDSTQLLPLQKQQLKQLKLSQENGVQIRCCATAQLPILVGFLFPFLLQPVFNFFINLNTLLGSLQCILIENLLNHHLLPSASSLPSPVLLEEAPVCPRQISCSQHHCHALVLTSLLLPRIPIPHTSPPLPRISFLNPTVCKTLNNRLFLLCLLENFLKQFPKALGYKLQTLQKGHIIQPPGP